MAGDTQRDKARAIFGKAFFENSKELPQPKNAAAALQKRANARPIPTYKVGGVVKKNPEVLAERGAKRAVKAEQDFSKPLREAVMRAAAKGTPVMKEGGPTDEYTAKRVRARLEAGNYKDGGEVDRYKGKLARKKADIEKDYQKALAKGKNADVAKAKYEQRMADAADDYAKWTKADRTQTSAAEKAAERALSEARRTKGQSIRDRDAKAAAPAPAAKPASAPAPASSFESDFDATFAARKSIAPKAAAPRKAVAPVRKVAAPVRRAAATQVTTPAPKTGSAAPKVTAGAAQIRTSGIPFLSARGKNVPKEPTMDQKRAARLAEFKAAAEKPNATGFEKDRYKRAIQTGMLGNFKTGGKVAKYAAGGAGKVRKGQSPMKKGK